MAVPCKPHKSRSDETRTSGAGNTQQITETTWLGGSGLGPDASSLLSVKPDRRNCPRNRPAICAHAGKDSISGLNKHRPKGAGTVRAS